LIFRLIDFSSGFLFSLGRRLVRVFQQRLPRPRTETRRSPAHIFSRRPALQLASGSRDVRTAMECPPLDARPRGCVGPAGLYPLIFISAMNGRGALVVTTFVESWITRYRVAHIDSVAARKSRERSPRPALSTFLSLCQRSFRPPCVFRLLARSLRGWAADTCGTRCSPP